jgi:excisionase family DNA binding protein
VSDRLAAAFAELEAAIREELASRAAGPAEPERLLSIDQAAEQLGIGRTSLYSIINRGELRTLKCGARHLVPRSAIADYATRGRE